MKLRYSSILRFLIILLITVIAFRWLDDNSLGFLFVIALISTIIFNVIIGDGFFLPKFGNITSSVIEGILALIFVYIIDLISENFNTELYNYLIFAILYIIFEYLFHRYLFSKEKVKL
ncbi:MAG: hypothetical protein K0Q49_2557 [Haloplasmataceae bacterium]|jgi:hypothetical protein|nr:hypothetical protein [Haloplasmataceae bacterium]